jgi:gamma-glutamyltranspeptidase / glutathione hydrolase
MKKFYLTLSVLLLSTNTPANYGPEATSTREAKPLAYGKHSMIVTNNHWATETAQKILDQGGNAFDAAVAASFVLGLTEPQSSGIGGGGYALIKTDKNLQSYDGRETAPHTANADWFLQTDNKTMSFDEMRINAKSVGTPAEVALLVKIHHDHGRLPWNKLLEPAIQLAETGFPMSKRLNTLLNSELALLSSNPNIKAVYFANDAVKTVGSIVKNPEYAATLKRLANNPQEFYQGKLANELIAVINQAAGRELYNKDDFTNYHVSVDKPVCSYYRNYQICSVAPSSSGGVALQELLRIYAANFNTANIANLNWMYQFLEASKLSYADRDQYLADPRFVFAPVNGLLDTKYIKQRSKQVGVKAMTLPVPAGKPQGADKQYAADQSLKMPGTTSLVIVDKDNNAISMTITVEYQFGSHIFTHGFFLNNQLTDFSFASKNAKGQLIANRIQPGKRPRSSIAATMVFKNGKLHALTGSPGGSDIPCYLAKNLILMLDMKKSAHSASASPNLCSTNTYTVLESEVTSSAAASYLQKKGEQFKQRPMVSGVTNIIKNADGGWNGAADPRREGVASGK